MVEDPKKMNILQVGNPEFGNVEVVQAYKDIQRGETREVWGYAIEDGVLCFYKLDPNGGGWIKMGDAMGSKIIWSWNPNGYRITISGSWGNADNTSVYIGRYCYNSTTAQNDTCAVGELVIPDDGDYIIYGMFVRDTDKGKCHFLFNGVDKGNIDTYGSGNWNYEGNLTVTLTKGVYELRLKVASKHASSSDYKLWFHSLAIIKA